MAVTVDEVALELGRATSDLNREQIEMWIGQAETLIRLRAEQRGVAFDSLDPIVVSMVVRLAVAAHVRNPDDVTQVSVSTDDASTSRTYKSGRGRITILDEWWTMLGLSRQGKAYAIDTVPRTGSGHVPWCNLLMGGTYCSCGASLTRGEYPLYEGGVLSPGGESW